MRKKKLAATSLALGLVLATAIGGSLAYFNDSESMTNHFTVGSLDITETEPSWDEEGGDGQNMYPGYTVTKDPTITNVTEEDDNPAYVRVIMTLKDKATGETITDADRIALIEQIIKYDSNGSFPEGEANSFSSTQIASTSMYNTTDWEADATRTTAAGAGVYYYNYKTKMDNDESSVLFNRIIIPTDWSQTQVDTVGDFNIQIEVQAIQSKSFDTLAEAMTALDTEVANGSTKIVNYKYVNGIEDGGDDAHGINKTE